MQRAIRIAVLVVASACFLVVFGVTVYFIRYRARLRSLHVPYTQIQRLATKDDVLRSMGPPDKEMVLFHNKIFWESRKPYMHVDPATSDTTGYVYYLDGPFYLRIIYEFRFNSDGLLIGKCRHD